MQDMFSIKEILQSEKFKRESPEKLKRLIPQSSLFLAIGSLAEITAREDRQPKPTITESKKENAA